METVINPSYKKDKIELPKLIHSHQLSTHSKSWIDNYYKDNRYSQSDCESTNVTDLPENERKSLEFKLWLEAGKVKPSSLPMNVDVSYNFNMWRNFKNCFFDNDKIKNEENNIIEEVAKIYPVVIPKPSKMEENNIIKYTESAKLINDPIKKKIILDKLKKNKQLMDQLKLKSEIRNPPINEQGNIKPPEGYKKFEHYFFPEPNCVAVPPKQSDIIEPDVFGRITDKKFKPNVWKLTYKSNNPSYKEAMQYRQNVLSASKQKSFD